MPAVECIAAPCFTARRFISTIRDIENMYFENVGGFQFQAAFNSLKKHGRIAVCGRFFQLYFAFTLTRQASICFIMHSVMYAFASGFVALTPLQHQ
jgi:NADPH-dependent curcumin reductase CurA